VKDTPVVMGVLIALLATGLAAQDGPKESPAPTAAGAVNIRPAGASNLTQADGDAISIGRYRRMASKVLAEDRLLQVRLPRDYDSAPTKRYPVLLQLDGEFAFLHAVATVEQSAVREGAPGVPDMIVVGIPNLSQSRPRDMLPPQSQHAPKDADPSRFLRFIKTEVIPFIDASYRTTDTRILVGQSTSGFFAWWALLREPGLFQAVVSISPSLADCRSYMADEVKARSRDGGLNGVYLYLTRGGQGREQGVAESIAMLLPLLEPVKGLTIRTKVYEELGHVPNPSLYDALKTMGTDLFSKPPAGR
jgi:predicted alpha/beta superfamily hydrolase